MQNRLVTRGVLIREEHIETLKRLPNKTMDAVLGAAFRVCLGQSAMLAVKDCNGILNAIVQSIAVSAKKFDENESAKRRNDAERKRRAREAEKNAQKDPLSVGHPSLSDGQTRTDADENGQKRTKADGRGIRTERKKEGKNIYTPISPKGICGDSSAGVDLDAMMSVIGADVGADQQEQKGEDEVPETGDCTIGETALESITETAATMTAAHPNKRGTDLFSRSLRRYLQKNPGVRLADIAEGHAAWLESGVWDEEGGRYAPQLARWLWGGDWKQRPPEKKAARPDPRVEDASVFHAGASL
jgi:hypothetical protein